MTSTVHHLYGWLHFRNPKGLSPLESRSNTSKRHRPTISVLLFNVLRTAIEILPTPPCNCLARQLAMCEQTVPILRMMWSQRCHQALCILIALTASVFSQACLIGVPPWACSCIRAPQPSPFTHTLFDFPGKIHNH